MQSSRNDLVHRAAFLARINCFVSRAILPIVVLGSLSVISAEPLAHAQAVLPNTKPLEWDGDIASKMIDGVDRFLLRKLADSVQRRDELNASVATSNTSAERRAEAKLALAKILGVRDQRLQSPAIELVATLTEPAELATHDEFKIVRIRWQAVGNIHAEGILLEPTNVRANVIAIPDAEQTPESIATAGYAPRLAASGCRVLIPSVINRQVQKRRNAELTNREFLHRSAFQLGRLVTGYELQKVLAAVDWCKMKNDSLPIGVVGWGEGGRLSLYAGALDDRIDTVCISGYFGPREGMWNEPLDRNVFGLLNRFGDAEVAALKTTGNLIVDAIPGPVAKVRTRGGAPYELRPFTTAEVQSEFSRLEKQKAETLHASLLSNTSSVQNKEQAGTKQTLSDAATRLVAKSLGLQLKQTQPNDPQPNAPQPRLIAVVDDTRQARSIAEMDQFNQDLLADSPYTRKKFLEKLDVSSVDAHKKTVESYRDFFRRDVIGEFDDDRLPLSPRSRMVFDQPKWTGYEVVLDVYPDVFAFGILLLPKDIQPGEKRPVVVCQHGLEGRPRNVIEKDHYAYHDYAAKLAERGFITFAPQNIYIFEDRFRTLQRKANPLGKTLFSIMVPQHQQIVDWLAGLPQVDPERIAFYGLSYGGKSAMRIPPLVDRYCLSICSADFNDWVWKNASTRSPYSYVWTGEYEIFEWDLGSNFNYSEMAALIAPKPFMVERGHFDGVAPDERVALEFAKVRHLYQAKLGIGDRCELEFFVGPHTINGKGTFAFLRRHLNWPKPTSVAGQ